MYSMVAQVSAAYDYDGVLILDSHNFRGMTQSGVILTFDAIVSCFQDSHDPGVFGDLNVLSMFPGVWVVLFYSYSVVIKDRSEAQNCQVRKLCL